MCGLLLHNDLSPPAPFSQNTHSLSAEAWPQRRHAHASLDHAAAVLEQARRGRRSVVAPDRAPQPLGDRARSREGARLEVGAVDVLAPQRRLAAEHLGSLGRATQVEAVALAVPPRARGARARAGRLVAGGVVHARLVGQRLARVCLLPRVEAGCAVQVPAERDKCLEAAVAGRPRGVGPAEVALPGDGAQVGPVPRRLEPLLNHHV
mmetsp:Transcript_38598/g.124649  ORF Transcript_38598/g.124649 Transcript_38598/m.124649 type:complete len:207 (-) Transcript_38598:749-1369(-)